MAIRVVKAFVRSKFEKEKFEVTNDDLKRASIMAEKILVWNGPLMTLAMYACIVAIVWFGGKAMDLGNMQVGEMIAFITYTMQIVMSFLMLTMMSVMLPRASVAAGRIDEVLQTETSVKENEPPKHLDTCKGVLAFDHVHFLYPHS